MNKEIRAEKEHLKEVISFIDNSLDNFKIRKEELRKIIIEERQRIWDDLIKGGYDFSEDFQDITTDSQADYLRSASYDSIDKKISRLLMLHDSPYFARIDFVERGYSEVETYYIGPAHLSDESETNIYVVDWRADIASLFYENGLGDVKFTTPYDTIYGKLLLRRQFKIENTKLKYMFDSDVAIEDNILQEELGKNTETKLKNIISTIQKEQNRIIRDLSCDVLLVQGVAGSGKTSIALHRLAYLLYRYRKSITSNSIMIFSPNNIFNGYIADVLPSLGENRAVQDSFYNFFSARFGDYVFESPVTYFERKLAHKDTKSLEFEKYLYSTEFVEKINNAFYEKANRISTAHSISFKGHLLMSQNEVLDRYNNWYKDYSSASRIQKILGSVMQDLENDCKKGYLNSFIKKQILDEGIDFTEEEEALAREEEWTKVTESIKNEVISMLTPDILEIYFDTIKKDGFDFDHVIYDENNEPKYSFFYPELFAITYLGVLSGIIRPMRKIAHVVIDEAQDYPPILFNTINLLFPIAKLTILGDISQKTSESSIEIEKIKEYFDKTISYYSLTRTYRSTTEINDYLKTLMEYNNKEIQSFDRKGNEVKFARYDSESFIETLKSLHDKGFNSNAIICKNEAECEKVYDLIRKQASVQLIKEDGVIRPHTDIIIPSYLTKGLEFDGIIVADTDDFSKDFPNLYYVSCSRALHDLTIIK